ncbi:MAG: hypothetical protein JJE05_11840 [Actinobacteria bacterium]|nr:hypothetical protein [Actinomycetota bacterium]
MESSVRSTRKTWLIVVAGIAAIALIGAPVVQAATQSVRVKGTVTVKGKVKIVDTNGQTISASPVADMGLLGARGSDGAVDVRTFGGGGGLLGTGDCTASVDPPNGDRPNSTTVAAAADTIINGIIVTGTDAKVAVTAPDLNSIIGPGAINEFRADANTPNVFVGLGNGLTVSPAALIFTCFGWDGTDGSGNYTILGQ